MNVRVPAGFHGAYGYALFKCKSICPSKRFWWDGHERFLRMELRPGYPRVCLYYKDGTQLRQEAG